MVFLTACNAIRSRGPDPWWRRQFAKRLTWHFYGRKRNCYKLSLTFLRRALRYATEHRALKREQMTNLNEIRIASACAEHGVQFSPFIETLRKNNIIINKKVLSELCIYEPRTFQSLCEYVKRVHWEVFQKNLQPSNRIITKGMLC